MSAIDDTPAPASPPAAPVDLDGCAAEPIRVPGGIQPHGALLAVDPDSLVVLQASGNIADFTGLPLVVGSTLGAGETAGLAHELRAWLEQDDTAFLRALKFGGRTLQVSAHRTGQGLIVEFERPPERQEETLEALYPRLRRFVETLDAATDVRAIAELAVREMRVLTGFNRVMLYAFDAEGVGTVLAEDLDAALPSYLDLRFPASDIPAQARELYRLNRLRIIPDANYAPVPLQPALSPQDGQPLDLSFAALRSVSPVHLEYMRNMGTLSSMSVSILVDGALWGLISCHHATPKGLNPQVRTACDFLGQIISLQIGARERGARAARRIALKQVEAELLAALSAESAFQEGLVKNGAAWLGMVDADGAALVTPEHLITFGSTPSQPELQELATWLHRREVGEVFATDSLAAHWAQGEAFAGLASGLLAISISQLHPSYIMWFREEVVRTVKWAGVPGKPVAETGRLHPRQSFALWREQVRMKSLPWDEVEIASARDFRNAVVSFVLRRAEERAQLSEQLRITNQELESFSYSISHDLRAPFRHIVGYSELLADRLTDIDERSRHYLNSIVEAAMSAGRLVDDLLNFSQLGRSNLNFTRVDMKKLVGEVRRSAAPDVEGRNVEWRIGELPPAVGDPAMLRQVVYNLVDNALKYSQGRDPAIIEIDGAETADELVYTVRDNGVGFDMRYVGKLFGVFQRLHRSEDFEGTGIGLALVKRILDRHGGRVSVEGEIDKGASVTFALPKQMKGMHG